MKRSRSASAFILAVVAGLSLGPAAAALETGVIRLASPVEERDDGSTAEEAASIALPEGRKGFDFEAFDARLQGLWFQRKALLAEGREADARRQSEAIRDFCSEEGVHRLEGLAGALVAEAKRYLEEGNFEKALAALDLAESFDPGRPQLRMARAAVLWKSGEGFLAAGTEALAAARSQFGESVRNLSLLNTLGLVVAVALFGCVVLFSLLMVVRCQVPLRHEVEEALATGPGEAWALAAGWGVLLLPFLIWIGAGWAALYWIGITFRYMRRAERAVAIVLLLAAILCVPAYRVAVTFYGVTADPVVRTSIASASGSYDPDRIVRVRELADSHPKEPIYRFLLAALYKNGRFFEEAYLQYKQMLVLDPGAYQALINIGNIFFQTGQYAEAATYYRRAIRLKPDSVLAYYNLHLAQSEAFNFKEAEASLNRAREIDAKMAAELLVHRGKEEERPAVRDVTVGLGAVWKALLGGRSLEEWLHNEPSGGFKRALALQFANPLSFFGLLALVACGWASFSTARKAPAGRCARCGRPFCQRCKSGRDASAYCSQCQHLFVRGDGLAPETKTRKLYEVERYERNARLGRRGASLVLPGAGHVLRGRSAVGCALMFLWLTALAWWLPGAFTPLWRIVGADLRLDLLRLGASPAAFNVNPVACIALPAAVLVWVLGNLWLRSPREA